MVRSTWFLLSHHAPIALRDVHSSCTFASLTNAVFLRLVSTGLDRCSVAAVEEFISSRSSTARVWKTRQRCLADGWPIVGQEWTVDLAVSALTRRYAFLDSDSRSAWDK